MNARRRSPEISVIVTAHDRLRFLPLALASVGEQTLADHEIILVDDGSTDGTAAWVRKANIAGLTLLRARRRHGIAASRNRALAAARGRVIAFLDSDDIWYPRHLEALVAALETPATVMAVGDYDSLDENGALTHRSADRRREKADVSFQAVSGLSATPCLSSCAFRREIFRDLGGFDEGFYFSDDLDFFYRVALCYGSGSITFIPRSLTGYRRHSGQITQVTRGIENNGLLAKTLLGGAADLSASDRACLLDMAYFYRKHAAALSGRD